MSSITRGFAQKKTALTRFIKPESPAYDDGTNIRLFPFTYSNGVLDISYSGNAFESIMVDTTGVAPDAETDTAVRMLSGPYLVNTLGENFKSYIRAWRTATIDAGSPINIYIAPQVMRVQEVDINNISANSSSSYIVSTAPPSGDGYVAGDSTNNFYATYVFKTPLTITTVEGGVTTYITFRTYMDQE
jgi:hypothetical protein